MLNVRTTAFVLIYVFTLLSGVDLFVVLLTVPMFAAILLSLTLTRPDRIGYIDIVAVIYFISFVIVPLQKVSNLAFVDSLISEGYPYPQWDFVAVAALALFSYAVLIAFLMPRRHIPEISLKLRHIHGFILIGIGASLAVAAIVAAGSIENLMAPRYLKARTDNDFFIPIITAALSINAVFAIVRDQPSQLAKYGTAAASCAFLLFVANPWNTARFFLLGAWIPVILCVLPGLLRPARFYLAIPATLLIVMPVLSITTRFDDNTSQVLKRAFSDQKSLFQIDYFDLFESGCDAIRYVSRFGHEYGSIFVSTIASFVPRSMWPEKPINSGLLVGWMNVDEGGGNENLAVPWFMDGYMDFGIAGALVYAVLLGAAFAVIRKLNGRVNGVDLTMFIFIANCPILIRGTLAVVYVMILFQLVFLFIYKKVFAQQVNPAPVRRRLGSRGPIVRQRRHPRSV